MRRISMTVLALFSAAVLAAGQNAAQKYVEQLKTTDELKEAVWGIRAVKVGGGGVAEYNSRTRMMPASRCSRPVLPSTNSAATTVSAPGWLTAEA